MSFFKKIKNKIAEKFSSETEIANKQPDVSISKNISEYDAQLKTAKQDVTQEDRAPIIEENISQQGNTSSRNIEAEIIVEVDNLNDIDNIHENKDVAVEEAKEFAKDTFVEQGFERVATIIDDVIITEDITVAVGDAVSEESIAYETEKDETEKEIIQTHTEEQTPESPADIALEIDETKTEDLPSETAIVIESKPKPEEKISFFKKISSAVEAAVEKTAEAVKSTLGIDKIKEGLSKTRKTFSDTLKKTLGFGRKIDEVLLNEIEEILITADIGVDTTEQIIESLRVRVKKENYENAEDLYELLREEIEKILVQSPSAQNDKIYEISSATKPFVILVIGVNGVGKTTTIGKLAYNYKNKGKNVIIGAADTFRAAANEQLEIWSERAGVDIVQQKQGADPAAVAFDTLKSAQAKDKDIVIIDTAGRLHNKTHLMAELDKISRVMKKLKDDAPNEVYLILDATTGQNAIFQAKEFAKVAPITGIILTKLDGTAKGGVVIPIANELKIPVRYIGVGEKIDDLQIFDPKTFVDALFGTENEEKGTI